MTGTRNRDVLSIVHFGDLHITSRTEQNYRDFLAIIEDVNSHLSRKVDFAVLPGDNAEDGTPEQFEFVKGAVENLKIPLKIIPGDHDFKSRSLDDYYFGLRAEALPNALTIGAYRNLFLDVVSNGAGGPDFRLGRNQLIWLQEQIQEAEKTGEKLIVFMHCYPEDLKEGAGTLAALFAHPNVIAVDTGHTHYNELVNRDRTIYAATRSTGQIEEGPVGFSILAVDRGTVSWRFKPLVSSWPFVVITSPPDKRLATDPAAAGDLKECTFPVRALVFGADDPFEVEFQASGGPWQRMFRISGTSLWEAVLPAQKEPFVLTVRARTRSGKSGEETIQVAVSQAGMSSEPIGAWPEKHILGTQLGPNKNGRKW